MYYDPKKGLWREQVTAGGKRRVFSAKTKKEVKLKILLFQEEQKNAPLFGATAKRWRATHEDQAAPGTWRSYDAALNRAIKEFGLRPLNTIKPGELQRWINGLGLARKTAMTHKTVISAVYDFAIVEEGQEISNPCDHIKVSEKLARGSRRALDDWEIREIMKTGPDEFILAPLILYTGCRCGEALALQGRDIDREHGVIHISKSVRHDGNQPVLGPLKTEMSDRLVPLLPQLRRILDAMEIGDDDYVVSGPEPLTASALSYRWRKWEKAHNVQFDRHSIRHAFATALLESDVSVKGAQALMGHSNFSTTMDIYTHIREAFLAEEAEKLAGYFPDIC